MNDGSEARPDGLSTTEETRRLRVATRALRDYLDDLPIDYDLDVPGDDSWPVLRSCSPVSDTTAPTR